MRGEVEIRGFVQVNICQLRHPNVDAELVVKYVSLELRRVEWVINSNLEISIIKRVFKTNGLDNNIAEECRHRSRKPWGHSKA